MGIILDPLERIITTLSNCVHVRNWMGFPDATPDEVKKRIYLDGISAENSGAETMSEDQQSSFRPHILVFPSAESGYHFSRNAAPNCFAGKWTAVIVFSKSYDESISINDYFQACANEMEKIVSHDDPAEPGILEMGQYAGYVQIEDLSVYFEGRTPEEHRSQYGDAYDVVFVLEYR